MVDDMIRLFEQDATSFATNGIGSLPDATKCEVTEERNGSFELEMEYHISGRRYSELELRRIIVAKPNAYADPQPFRIYYISKPINGVVTVKAEHISYDMSGYPVAPFNASSASDALSKAASYAITSHPFTFQTDISDTTELAFTVPMSMRSLIGSDEGSVLDVYGGEWEFDGFKAILHAERGEDRGVTVRYGKNMTDLTQEENCSEVYTAVYPFWYSDDWGLIELPEKTVACGGTYNYTRILTLDLSREWDNTYEWADEYPSEDEIRWLAEDYIEENEVGVPKVSLTVSFAQLSESGEYAQLALLETVRLCDTVRVEFPELGVSSSSKCIKTTYDALTGKYVSIELGEAKSDLATSIASHNSEVEEKIAERPTMTFMDQAVDNATQLVTGGLGGYVVIRASSGTHPDEILIMNTPDITTATKVWRWNKGGLGYSPNGYNGPYTTAITQDGAIVADFITAGHMLADIIQGGTFVVGGFDNKDGTIEVRNASNTLLVKMGVDGLQFYNSGGEVITDIIDGRVTTSYVNALEVKAGSVDAEDINAGTITGMTIKGSTITAGGTSSGVIEVRDASNTLLIKLSKDGLEFYNSGGEVITDIIDGRVTTSYVNALKVKAGSVDAENITGTTITGKTISGGTITIGDTFSVSDGDVSITGDLTSNGSIKVTNPRTGGTATISYGEIAFKGNEITGDEMVPVTSMLGGMGLEFDVSAMTLSKYVNVGEIQATSHIYTPKLSAESVYTYAINCFYGYINYTGYGDVVTDAPNLFIGTKDNIRKTSGSSRRWKHDITTDISEELDPHRLYDINVVQFKFNDDYLDAEDVNYGKDVIGLIAEDVYEKYPIGASYDFDEDGEAVCSDWNYRYILPAMLKLLQEQKRMLDSQQAEIAELKAIISESG